MNIKNGLILLVGALLGILGYGALSIAFDDEPSFKDWFPSFITGIVTLAALLFGYLNNKEQRELQLAISVEKDWLENVRKHVTTLVDKAFIVAHGSIATAKKEDFGDGRKKYEADVFEFLSSRAALVCYLDKSRPLENKLLSELIKFYYFTFNAKDDNDLLELTKTSDSVVAAAHNLFNSKRI